MDHGRVWRDGQRLPPYGEDRSRLCDGRRLHGTKKTRKNGRRGASATLAVRNVIEMPTVREQRERYFAENGFGTSAYDAAVFRVRVGPICLPFPNPGLLPFHDLHHVLTGYGTGLIGEAETSAFELRTGCPSPIVLMLCIGSIAIGLFLAPRRIRCAWRSARDVASLYGSTIALDDLLDLEITELRRRLRIPPDGLAAADRAPVEVAP
jgi:hypothetical protein